MTVSALNELIAALITDDCAILEKLFSLIPKSTYAVAAQSSCALLREGLLPLVIKFILVEVDPRNLSVFLRGNSITPKLVSSFVTELSQPFLKTINPILSQIANIDEQLSPDNPSHILKLISFASSIISTLDSSLSLLNRAVSCLLYKVSESLDNYDLPELSKSALIGGIFMLRLISPHVVSFSSHVTNQISKSNLIAVAKLLQSASNSTPDYKYDCVDEMNKLRLSTLRLIKSSTDDLKGLDFSDLNQSFVFDPSSELVSLIQSNLIVSTTDHVMVVLRLISENVNQLFAPFFDCKLSPSLSWGLYTTLYVIRSKIDLIELNQSIDTDLFEPICDKITSLSTDFHHYYTSFAPFSTSPLYMDQGTIYVVIREIIALDIAHPTDFLSLFLFALELSTLKNHQNVVIDLSGSSYSRINSYLFNFLKILVGILPYHVFKRLSLTLVLASPQLQEQLKNVVKGQYYDVPIRNLGWGLNGTLIGVDERSELRRLSLSQSSRLFSTFWCEVSKINRFNKSQKRLIKPTPVSLLNLTVDANPQIQTEMSYAQLKIQSSQEKSIILTLDDVSLPARIPGKWLKSGQNGDRILECVSIEERDLMVNRIQSFLTSFDMTFKHVFEVEKVNNAGKAQKRTLVVTVDSLLNLANKTVKWEEALAGLQYVTVESNLVVVKFWHAEEPRRFIAGSSTEANLLKNSINFVANNLKNS
ncbi:hypothetical protein RCL1_006738 [Eukaryota sp. TZLM3-RCL]